MDDHLVDGPPTAKRPKLDPFQGPGDSSDVLSNMDIFDLENDLPDELISSGSSWGMVSDPMENNKLPSQSPGPGGLQNEVENQDASVLRQPMQLIHLLQQRNKGLVGNTLSLAGAQLGSKSPNLPPNVSVTTKGILDPMTSGSLPSSIPNSVGLQSIANNNGNNSSQVMNSMQGMNNSVAALSAGGMIMTNSNMGSMGNMGGGGLVVSSSLNKPPNAGNMMSSGKPHLASNHNVQQNLQNRPMMPNRTVGMQHINVRAPGPHNVQHSMGPRMQQPGMLEMGNVNQGMAGNNYTYSNPNSAARQNLQIGVVAPQQRSNNINIQQRFGPAGPGGSAPGGEGGMAQTQPPAPSPAQPQSGAPSSSQSGSQTATQNQPGTGVAAASTDPNMLKLIQQQLAALLHADKCQRLEVQANGEIWQCTLPHCMTMKNVLNHMTTSCQAGKSCNVPHCSSSRQIISHWKHCIHNNCPVCLPLKQAIKNRNNANATANPPQTTQSPNPSAYDVRRAYDALGIQCPTTGGSGPTPAGLIPNTPARLNLRLPIPGGTTIPNLTTTMGGVRVLAPQRQVAPNDSLPLGSDPSSTAMPSSVAQVAANIQQSVLMFNNCLVSDLQLMGKDKVW